MAGASDTNPTAAHREPTAFERRLHQATKAIPAGKVTTYGAVADVLNSAPRAVGQALKRNPYAPQVPGAVTGSVPCHRVISASLAVGGFSGAWGTGPQISRKLDMLQAEGVKFTDGKLSDPEKCLLDSARLKEALCTSEMH